VSQVKVDAVHGRDDLQANQVVSWPKGVSGQADPFTFPRDGAWAAKLFGDVGAEGRMRLIDPRRGERLEMVVDRGQVPQVGLWINCRGWAPPRRTNYYNFGLEPCIGAPDRLDRAVSDWKTAQILQPGELREWSLEVWLLDEAD
jgi:hypothetical protein